MKPLTYFEKETNIFPMYLTKFLFFFNELEDNTNGRGKAKTEGYSSNWMRAGSGFK